MKHVDYFLPTHLPSLPSLPRVPAHEEGREGDDGLDGERGAREEVLYDRKADDEEGVAVCPRLVGGIVAGGHEDLCRREGGREGGKEGMSALDRNSTTLHALLLFSPPTSDRLTLSIGRLLWLSTPTEMGKEEGSMEVPSMKGRTVLGTTRLRVAWP
jgi:hypothetical protein